MISITKIQYLGEHKLALTFSDGVTKSYNFDKLISYENWAKPLEEKHFFEQVKIYEDGRGIFWPNEYDCCPDWLRYYALDEKEEWIGYDDSFELKDRIKLIENKLFA
jgi:hypothetical protein